VISASGGRAATWTSNVQEIHVASGSLSVDDGLLVERGNPHRERIDESVKLRVRQSRIPAPIDSAISPRISSAPRSTSSARPRPLRRLSRAIGPPPGTRSTPTSHCNETAFSLLAKRMSVATASSLLAPLARPPLEAIDTTRARLIRASKSGSACKSR
jgi:hypothetical protein